MPIEFACEDCGSVLRVPDGTSGKRSRCPTCKHEQEIPWVVSGGQEAVASDKLSIPCPKCQHHLVCSPALLGTRGQCKKCQHIFTISTDPVPSESSTPDLVFHCPKCQQLFEGSESMRGRKGKCHVCKSVFMIELQPADPAASSHRNPATSQPANTPLNHSSHSSHQPSQPTHKPAGSPSNRPSNQSFNLSSSDEDDLIIIEETPRPKLRTPAPVPTPAPAVATPIRFECSQCRGVMEVPGTTAGLETECPYCRTVQTIPAASTVRSQPVAPRYPASASHSSGHGLDYQVGTNQGTFDPLGGLDLGSVNPYAAPTQNWSAPSSPSYGSSSSQVTVGNVLKLGFDSLLPSCLMIFLYMLVSAVVMGVLFGLLQAVMYLVRDMGESRIYIASAGLLVMALCIGLMSAWLAGAMSRLALNAVRKKPFDFADAFNASGAFSSAIVVVGGGLLLMLLMYAPSILHLSTGALKGLEFLIVGWILLFIPVMMLYSFGTSLALFAGADGEPSIESLKTSMSLIFKNFGTALAVLLLSGLISGVLALFTLGASYMLPIYMTAALYHLASRQSR